ncbi:MAG: tetratricopeptide repeat protein [Candidatus Zixiibacteriota bacterium]
MKKIALIALLGLFLILLSGCNPKEITSAKVYIQQKNFEDALVQLQQASEKYPGNANAHYLLGQVYAELDSFEQMNEAFDKTLAVDSSYAEEIKDWRQSTAADAFNRGVKYSKREQWEDALEWYELSTKINPDNSNFWKNLGYTYTKLDQPDKAIETYKKALEHDPTDLPIALETARFYLSTEKPENARKAIEVLENIQEHYPDSAHVYIQLGEAYSVAEQQDKAIATLEKAQQLDPDNALLAFRLGAEFYDIENYDKAADNFGKYIEENEQDTSGYFNLMIALSNAKRFEDGIKIGKIMTEKFPGFPAGWERYAVMLAQGGKSKEDKVLGVIALSIAEGLKAIEEGDAQKAIDVLKDVKTSSIKDRLPKIIEQAKGDEAVKQKVLDSL